MDTQKSFWLNNGDDVRLVMPISKVDVEHRTVSGFASLNNVDKTDDVVTAEASAEAFMSFRGNIREMHQPIAAGKMLSFSQEPYYDAATGATYQGIYVTVYVSKGAEDTWQKVLDGTLTGFSIGGHILDQHSEYMPELGKAIRFITGLSLFELSLVDNPANQFANVLSISKVDGELVAKGMVVDAETQNVFWCEIDKTARSTAEDSASCVQCSADMQNIGWIEVTDSVAATAELKKFVDEWTEKVITAQQIKEETAESVQQNSRFANEEKIGDNNTDDTAVKSEGGVNVSNVETVEEVVEPVEKAAEVEEVVEETVEKADEAAETVEETVEKADEAAADESVEEDALAKAMEELKTYVSEAVEKSASEQATFAETVTNAISEISKSLEAVKNLAESFEKTNGTVAEVAEKVEGLERATAVKKSGDDDSSEPVKKGFSWGGHFASASTITEN
jgi:hypothetical protein